MEELIFNVIKSKLIEDPDFKLILMSLISPKKLIQTFLNNSINKFKMKKKFINTIIIRNIKGYYSLNNL